MSAVIKSGAITNPIHHAHVPGFSWDMPALCKARNDPTGFGSRSVKIAILELGGGYVADNFKKAFGKWGLAEPTIEIIRGNNQPGSDADGEVELDLQVAAARATFITGKPATIGMSFGGNSDQEFLAAWKAMIDWQPDAISVSWGGPESSWDQSVIQQFVALHQTANCPQFVASGDNNSSDGQSGTNVDFPGSSPFVIDCGGTWFNGTTEKVWNDGASEGTGGGYSRVFPVQSFQIGVPSGTGRMVPDLADVASPATGYNIYIKAQGGWQVIGGTSAVAPSMAGLFGAYQVEMEKRGLPRMAFITDRLYRHPVGFKDITVGDNGQWRAGIGPDPCTGLGVPDGTQLFNQLVGTTPAPPNPPNPTPIPVPTPTPTPIPPPANFVIDPTVNQFLGISGQLMNRDNKVHYNWHHGAKPTDVIGFGQ